MALLTERAPKPELISANKKRLMLCIKILFISSNH